MISVLIPARNEVYLEKTMRDILSKARGEIEVIVVLDGYLPDPQIDMQDDRVTFLHYEKAIGQRPAINEAARKAKGKYILKTDAHSMFDEGFDVKLAADCEYDWTVLPRMYNLDVEKWAPKRKKITDYMFIRSPYAEKKPFRHYYYDGPCKRENPREYAIHKQWKKDRPEIDDVMTGQGACFFMHKDRFWELGGMDEGHGQWGQMGIEVALKAWLSGGRHVVNKKTWFAHYFRGGSGPGFPWPASGAAQEEARKYSRDLWLNNKWPLQKRPLSWLVEKFAPVPTWKTESVDAALIKLSERPEKPSEHLKTSQNYCKDQLDEPVKEVEPYLYPSIRNNDAKNFVVGREMDVKEIFENKVRFARGSKRHSIRLQSEIVPPFVKRVLSGEEFDDDKIKRLAYYRYLLSRLNPAAHPQDGEPTPRGVRHALNLVKDFIKLARSIKDSGLMSPLDLFCNGKMKEVGGEMYDELVIVRGSRRLAILYELGVEKVPARIWKSEHLCKTFIPTARWPVDDDSIHALAVKQFVKHGVKATDKYWRHSYAPWYNAYIGHWQVGGAPKNILELGVSSGMSLLLWHDAFKSSNIYGLDIDLAKSRNTIKGKKRIKVTRGNQKDTNLLEKMAAEQGPYNVIIDDASHLPQDQRRSFGVLWKHLVSGGTYVIEDFHHNYKDKWENKNIKRQLKNMVDKIYTTNEVRDVAFHPNIVFITKA
jgi:glycosyltransferase involved in cell wall biosynthesis